MLGGKIKSCSTATEYLYCVSPRLSVSGEIRHVKEDGALTKMI